MIGLSTTDVDASYSSINYAFYPAGDGTLYIYESGNLRASSIAPYTATDVLRVERSGTTVVYKKNGVLLYTSPTSSSGALHVDCSFYSSGANLTGISIGVSGVQLASYQYNELGQLVDKKLHSTDGSNFLQSVDFRYSIRGWLTSINNSMLTSDNGATNDESNDYFGMELLYNNADNNLGTTPYYNGNISAIKWKGVGTAAGYDNIHSYRYVYDKSNRLTWGNSNIYQQSTNAWTKESGAIDENMTYDLNGNIQTLQRNHRKNQSFYTYTSETMDNLSYAYNPAMGDQLLKVTDAANNAGFDNGGSGSNNDYSYDINGNLTSDLNKGISNITYNYLNKPTSIVYTDGRRIDYGYDAGGTKLSMKTYASNGVLQSTTDYVDAFVYVDNTLNFFSSPEGRVFNNNGNLEYQYSIADNQGNTRVVFTSVNPTTAPVTATFEDAVADSKVFQNVNTSSMYWVSKSGANNTSGGQYVMRMNSTYPVGPSKSLKVFPGDVVNMEVWSYYEGSNSFGGSDEPLTALITQVASAFGGVSGGAGESGLIYSGVNTAYNFFGAPANQTDAVPTAHLNYILFDKDYNLLDMGWQGVQSTANFSAQKIAFNPVTIKEAGYLYVYLSYEGTGTNWVYFDDLKVTHTKTNVIQYNEYYPFGLQTNASWARDNATNNFLYNQGSELNASSGWYDLPFRNYDPMLGRFVQIDPLSVEYDMLTPYNYAANNPIYFNDPSGLNIPKMYPQDPTVAAAIQAELDHAVFGGGGGSSDGWMDWDAYYNQETLDLAYAGNASALKQLGAVTITDRDQIAAFMDGGGMVTNSKGQTGYYQLSVNPAYDAEGFYQNTEQKFVKFNQTGGAQQEGPGDGDHGDGRGSAKSFSFGFAFGFGISGEWGIVSDETGKSKWYWTVSANTGLALDIGFNVKEIIPTSGNRFRVEQYEGRGKNISVGVAFTSETRGGNTQDNPTLNPMDFGSLYKERANSYSPFLGIPVGISDAGFMYQISKTSFFK